MDLIYPINFIGHEQWLESGYALDLARGDVITRDGEVIGTWRVADYDPDAAYGEHEGGRYEFAPLDHSEATITERFAILDSGMLRGMALSFITRAIREAYDAAHPDAPISRPRSR